EGTAKHARDTADQQDGLAAKFPAAARAKLQAHDYDGVAAVLNDAKGSAQALADESSSAAERFDKRAEDAGEFKGLKIGDVKILGMDSETKKSRKWSSVTDSFKQLAKEAGELAR
ncbi:MAG: hypothetical protein KIS92_13390, partial [Planctomycetota bacterium]|nr:hypothetical protein [Planctomycetota bacterium]